MRRPESSMTCRGIRPHISDEMGVIRWKIELRAFPFSQRWELKRARWPCASVIIVCTSLAYTPKVVSRKQ